jgi:hypothetical protein
MRVVKAMGALVGVLVLSVLSFFAWIWWESQHPRLPNGWPPSSAFIQAPHALPGYLLVGVWVGCRLGTQRNVDTCKFANYKGKLMYEGDYTTCDNQPPLPDERLRLRSENQATVRVFLQDGTMLIPVDFCNPRKRSSAPLNTLPLVN